MVYKDFLFGFWLSGDLDDPQITWITWIGEGEEAKVKAIRRLRRFGEGQGPKAKTIHRLHRLEKDKNRDTMRAGTAGSIELSRLGVKVGEKPRLMDPPCANGVVKSATSFNRSLAGVQAPLFGFWLSGVKRFRAPKRCDERNKLHPQLGRRASAIAARTRSGVIGSVRTLAPTAL